MEAEMAGFVEGLNSITVYIIIIAVAVKVLLMIKREFGFGIFKEMYDTGKLGIQMSLKLIKEKSKKK